MAARKKTGSRVRTPHDPVAENPSIDACIKECYQHLHGSDVQRYNKEFESQPHDEDQVLHTFRELLFGSYLIRNGWRVRAYQKIDGNTPDWCVLGDSDEPSGIIDVVNLHADKLTDDRVKMLFKQGKPAPLSADEAADSKRVYDSIKGKCIKYRELVKSRNFPYIIGLFPQFNIPINHSQVVENLYLPPTGLFLTEDLGGYPNVSGLAFLSELSTIDNHDSLWMGYRFDYFPNPYARRPLTFPSGAYWNPLLCERRSDYRKMIADLKARHEFEKYLFNILPYNRMADVFGPLLATLQSLSPEQANSSQDGHGTWKAT